MEFLVQFVDGDGKPTGPQVTLPTSSKVKDLNTLINEFLANEESTPYSFYAGDEQIVAALSELEGKQSSEDVLRILYRPEATFGIRSVSYCSAKLPGHSQIVLCISFSSDGLSLVTGGGDGSVISWDVTTQSLKQKIPLGNTWIQAIEWHSSSQYVACGCTDGMVRILQRDSDLSFSIKNSIKVSKVGKVFAVAWEPYHSCKDGILRLAAATDIGEIIIIDAISGARLSPTISGHAKQIMCLAWGAHNVLYSASHDRNVKAWDTITGVELAVFGGRGGAWRTISISTQYPLRTGPFELGHCGENDQITESLNRLKKHESKSNKEMIAVGNEDFTVALLTLNNKKEFVEIARLSGHKKLVNHVLFSPNGYWLATASFDHSVKLFDGRTGKFVCTLGQGRGKNTGQHVKEVYRLAWSADSRLLLSGSADTTVKLWNISKQKLQNDLTGHEDAIYAVDWNPAGFPAASGGKDKQVMLWR